MSSDEERHWERKINNCQEKEEPKQLVECIDEYRAKTRKSDEECQSLGWT